MMDFDDTKMTPEQQEKLSKITQKIIDEWAVSVKTDGYGIGAWSSEPNFVFYFENGYPCLIIRMQTTGHLCGYVGIPKERAATYAKNSYSDFATNATGIDVHGDITFFGSRDAFLEPEHQNKYIFMGFDCAHAGDLVPSLIKFNKAMQKIEKAKERILGKPSFLKKFALKLKSKTGITLRKRIETYKDINFVKKQITRIIDQLESK